MIDGSWQIVIAEDHSMVREGLKALLQGDPRCHAVGEAGTLAEVRTVVAGARPDLLLLDIALGRENGLDAVEELLTSWPQLRIVVLTMHDDPAFAREALNWGVHGYLLKEAAAADLIRAIEVVMTGGTYLHPQLGAEMVSHRPSAAERLTERERDVLRLLADGHTNVEIARGLHVSVRTVEVQRAALRTRLGVVSRAELVDAARKLRLA
jgi:two-component system response regulator NreC